MEKKIIIGSVIITIIIIIISLYFYKKSHNKNEKIVPEQSEEQQKKIVENFEKMIMEPPLQLEQIRKDVLNDKEKCNSFKLLVNRASDLGAKWADEEKTKDWYKNSPDAIDLENKKDEKKE